MFEILIRCVDTRATTAPRNRCYCEQGYMGKNCQKTSVLSQKYTQQELESDFNKRELSDRLNLHWKVVDDELEVVMKMKGDRSVSNSSRVGSCFELMPFLTLVAMWQLAGDQGTPSRAARASQSWERSMRQAVMALMLRGRPKEKPKEKLKEKLKEKELMPRVKLKARLKVRLRVKELMLRVRQKVRQKVKLKVKLKAMQKARQNTTPTALTTATNTPRAAREKLVTTLPSGS